MNAWPLASRAHGSSYHYVPILVLIVVSAFFFAQVRSASQFEVHRLLQADLDGISIGSRSSKISTYATLPTGNARMFHTVVLLPLQSSTEELLKGVLGRRTGADGVVIVLPSRSNGMLTVAEAEQLEVVQTVIAEASITAAVYFAYENSILQTMVKEIGAAISAGNPPSLTSSRYEVFVSGLDVSEIKSPQSVSYVAWLPAVEGTPLGRSSAPTIAISAYYDTFSLAPSLAFGSDANGSGVNVLVHLMKLVKKLYQGTGTRGQYNLLFLLTSGGPYSFEGTRRWLNDADSSFLEAVDFAICLDSLFTQKVDNTLYLHYAKPPKDEQTQEWYETLKKAGSAAGVHVEEVHKKVNISSASAAWEHEQFSKRRITAVTLSARPTPATPLGRSAIEDDYAAPNTTAVITVVDILARALSKVLFPDIAVDTDLISVSSTKESLAHSIDQWAKVLHQTPRMIPYFTPDNTLHQAFEQHMKAYSDATQKHHWQFDQKYKFHNGTAAEMSVFKTSSILYDVSVFLGVASYLLALFAALRIVTRGWDDFVSMFQTSRTKYKRS